MSIKQIIKDWTLPISMLVGVLGYILFTQLQCLSVAKGIIASSFPYILPTLICVMLFFTYCKIEPRDLRPRKWHLWLIVIQLVEVALAVWWCVSHRDSEWMPLAEALLACFIAPMAAVGAVVTQKIGGNAATATTYTIISSTFTAIMVPIVYPIVEPGLELSFVELFLRILSRVFPTIMAPLVLSLLLWWLFPKVKGYVAEKSKDYSFYLWALCTIVNTAQIIKSIVSSDGSKYMVLWICLIVGVLVFVQFFIGKTIGSAYGDRIAAGQGLAQKNTVLSIWMAMSFLNPQAAIGPGACLLWQNLFNSWQIWKHNRTK
ncbi:MAG: transporter [Bacteroidia bacterium]|nr:transporter [Bacteroidia bacterium]